MDVLNEEIIALNAVLNDEIIALNAENDAIRRQWSADRYLLRRVLSLRRYAKGDIRGDTSWVKAADLDFVLADMKVK
jgi:hypothetical protein